MKTFQTPAAPKVKKEKKKRAAKVLGAIMLPMSSLALLDFAGDFFSPQVAPNSSGNDFS